MENKTIEKNIVIKSKQGLHARPAALFVQIANKFDSDIFVVKDGEEVNGKSIMGILMLAAEKGAKVCLKAIGTDAEEAVIELEKILLSESQDLFDLK
ncbi:MAG: HPr family phosphocarrier protein [Candidatus Orphnella occulta]|nr:HPr family phosphocarrier protein [Candidatus Orphnella occulta]MDP8297703.1 HPr family phosphocarrier protein [Candidatus Orphnella occulta]